MIPYSLPAISPCRFVHEVIKREGNAYHTSTSLGIFVAERTAEARVDHRNWIYFTLKVLQDAPCVTVGGPIHSADTVNREEEGVGGRYRGFLLPLPGS